MPHIIVEYSTTIEPTVDIESLLEKLHNSLAKHVDLNRIKTRAIALNNNIVGSTGHNGHMVHTTLLLLEGRDIETKQIYGKELTDIINNDIKPHFPNCAITLEVRDMSAACYFM